MTVTRKQAALLLFALAVTSAAQAGLVLAAWMHNLPGVVAGGCFWAFFLGCGTLGVLEEYRKKAGLKSGVTLGVARAVARAVPAPTRDVYRYENGVLFLSCGHELDVSRAPDEVREAARTAVTCSCPHCAAEAGGA